MVTKKLKLPFKLKRSVLAFGSQMKNTICFARGNAAYISPVHNNLDSPADFLQFEKDVQSFLKNKPKVFAYDLHPEYASTKYAFKRYALCAKRYAIQHHHAHVASCMAANGLKNRQVIGVVFDGTGLGNDNTLWGAEFLLCDYKNFKRLAHLQEIPLAGAEKAIAEPYRLTMIWLHAVYKDKFLDLNIDFTRKLSGEKWRVIKRMFSSGFNSPLASSMGRLFDAAASLVLTKYKAGFEAELPVRFEGVAKAHAFRHSSISASQLKKYSFSIEKKEDRYILIPRKVFQGIVTDLKKKVPRGEIAFRFHLTVAEMVRQTCLTLRKKTGNNRIVLSGGVFQNNLLLKLCLDLLYKERFTVFTHKYLSCNDSCISLGEAVIAGARSLN